MTQQECEYFAVRDFTLSPGELPGVMLDGDVLQLLLEAIWVPLAGPDSNLV